jgi:hypothetical protein
MSFAFRLIESLVIGALLGELASIFNADIADLVAEVTAVDRKFDQC